MEMKERKDDITGIGWNVKGGELRLTRESCRDFFVPDASRRHRNVSIGTSVFRDFLSLTM